MNEVSTRTTGEPPVTEAAGVKGGRPVTTAVLPYPTSSKARPGAAYRVQANATQTPLMTAAELRLLRDQIDGVLRADAEGVTRMDAE